MKFSLMTVAVPALLASTAHGLVIRNDATGNSTMAAIDSLVADANQHADTIASTRAQISSTSSAAQNATAANVYAENFRAINTDVMGIKSELKAHEDTLNPFQLGGIEAAASELIATVEELAGSVLSATGLNVVSLTVDGIEDGVDGLVGGLEDLVGAVVAVL